MSVTHGSGAPGKTGPGAGPGAGASAAEIARFDALAGQWWDPSGPMAPLHAMNRLRVAWIGERIARRFPGPVRLLDVGCGGGLASEAFAKRGHKVTGLDAATEALAAAAAHAAASGLTVDYRAGLAEDLLAEGLRYPVITCLEVIEHVPDPAAFAATLAALLEPGGLLFLSTLNRTSRSWLTAILGAEYALRMLPVGTHDWKRFVTPAELGRYLRDAGLLVSDIAGMAPDPLRGGWRTRRDTAVNYIAMALRSS
jgi:2-polyprenyl-6-hydroxyphenyl methylase/3-demethylubiquinone-9 3-methyltransferase